MKVELNLKYFY